MIWASFWNALLISSSTHQLVSDDWEAQSSTLSQSRMPGQCSRAGRPRAAVDARRASSGCPALKPVVQQPGKRLVLLAVAMW